MEEDKFEVTHLMGKKLDKPITIKLGSEPKKNKMEQVADLFGKKLNEEFEVNFFDNISKARFTVYGFEEHFNTPGWWSNSGLLQKLLIGKAVIVNEGNKIDGNKTPHWIEHPHESGENWEFSMYECSDCHEWSDNDSNYCPNCGAEMKGGK